MTVRDLHLVLPLDTIIECYDNKTGELKLISHGRAGIVEGNKSDLDLTVKRITEGKIKLYASRIKCLIDKE